MTWFGWIFLILGNVLNILLVGGSEVHGIRPYVEKVKRMHIGRQQERNYFFARGDVIHREYIRHQIKTSAEPYNLKLMGLHKFVRPVADGYDGNLVQSSSIVRRSVPSGRNQTSAWKTPVDYRNNTQQDTSKIMPKTYVKTNKTGNHSSMLTKTTQLNKLYIGGLFELSHTPLAVNGYSELMAAQLAIKHINERNYLPGYSLEMFHNDTKCDPGVGADVFYDMVYRKPPLSMVIGSACSEVTKTVGQVVPYWNLLLVSFGATSPALSTRNGSKTSYPTFYRLASADSSHNEARKAFIQRFNWDSVATLHYDQETFALAMNDMYKVFENADIKLKVTQTFRNTDDLGGNLLKLKELDARIIIGSFSEDMAKQVFCQAYNIGFYGSKYVWILLGGYSTRWWTAANGTNCTGDQLTEVAQGYIDVEFLNELSGNQTSFSGLTNHQFWREYNWFSNITSPSPFTTQTYDTVWTVAMTIKKTISVMNKIRRTSYTKAEFTGNGKKSNNKTVDTTNSCVSIDTFSYHNGKQLRKTMFDIMGNLEFVGVSGPISFRGSDRLGITAFHQMQNGARSIVALYHQETGVMDFKCLQCGHILWKGGKVPVDKSSEIYTVNVIDKVAFGLTSGFCLAGVLLACGFLTFNIYFRKLKYIKLSSPKLNNVAVCGCITVYIAVMLLGFDDGLLTESMYPYICTTRAFLFAGGFTLSFGSMFVKTYRVHHLFTRRTTGLVRRTMLKDNRLLAIVGCLLALDTTIILIWLLTDPMYRETRNFTIQTSEDENSDELHIPQISKCHSIHQDKFMGALYTYKGLLLIFGVYMAWTTRHVQIPALNDSKYIGLNVYNVVTMSALTVVLSSILSEQPTLEFIIVSSLLIVSTTVMLCLLFVPKLHRILFNGDTGPHVVTSTGIRLEARTRRMTTDANMERRELNYRGDVQNRAFRRDILEMEKQIYQLQRLLCLDGLEFQEEFRQLIPAGDTTPILRVESARSLSITSTANVTDETQTTTADEDSGFNSVKSGQMTSFRNCAHLLGLSKTMVGFMASSLGKESVKYMSHSYPQLACDNDGDSLDLTTSHEILDVQSDNSRLPNVLGANACDNVGCESRSDNTRTCSVDKENTVYTLGARTRDQSPRRESFLGDVSYANQSKSVNEWNCWGNQNTGATNGDDNYRNSISTMFIKRCNPGFICQKPEPIFSLNDASEGNANVWKRNRPHVLNARNTRRKVRLKEITDELQNIRRQIQNIDDKEPSNS